jgi:hypothetical protein
VTSVKWSSTIRRAPLLLGGVCLVASAIRIGTASAEPPVRDPVSAEHLFRQAIADLKSGDWSGACGKFRKSMDLDPSVSTLANLAKCSEHDGKLATAWYEYQQALSLLGEMSYGPQRRQALRQGIEKEQAALEPRVPKLRIVITPIPTGLELWRDGAVVSLSVVGEPLPVDPGDHEVVARAPGLREERVRVSVESGQQVDATLVLEPDVSGPPPSAAARSAGPTAAATADSTSASPSPSASPSVPGERGATSGEKGSMQRRIAVGVGGVGVVLVGAAGYFGLRTLNLVSEMHDQCRSSGGKCEPAVIETRDRAITAQSTGLGLAGAGLFAVGLGVALFVTAPTATSRTGSAPGTWTVTLTSDGLLTRGTW